MCFCAFFESVVSKKLCRLNRQTLTKHVKTVRRSWVIFVIYTISLPASYFVAHAQRHSKYQSWREARVQTSLCTQLLHHSVWLTTSNVPGSNRIVLVASALVESCETPLPNTLSNHALSFRGLKVNTVFGQSIVSPIPSISLQDFCRYEYINLTPWVVRLSHGASGSENFAFDFASLASADFALPGQQTTERYECRKPSAWWLAMGSHELVQWGPSSSILPCCSHQTIW